MDSPVDQTVLVYLRENGLVGTKEGCASGDCGACTVMVGSNTEGRIVYHTRNSCITPMNQLAGNHLITVEGLGDESQLHPVQQQMIAHHASQCGFCTPGFVVSLAALVESRAAPTREAVLEGLSGNLCRCTGYGPILASGLSALKLEYRSSLGSRRLIESLGQETGLCQFYRRPLSELDLQKDILENPGARLVAGGSDLMLEVTQEFRSFSALIDLTGVNELTEIDEDAGFIEIGAAVSYTRLEKFFLNR